MGGSVVRSADKSTPADQMKHRRGEHHSGDAECVGTATRGTVPRVADDARSVDVPAQQLDWVE